MLPSSGQKFLPNLSRYLQARGATLKPGTFTDTDALVVTLFVNDLILITGQKLLQHSIYSLPNISTDYIPVVNLLN